ncbi:MAG: hypothetical protein VX647_03575, partial [Pseudomonadota bacterium]|nr:hypothetical protein [Pseudomonadota bacterium]
GADRISANPAPTPLHGQDRATPDCLNAPPFAGSSLKIWPRCKARGRPQVVYDTTKEPEKPLRIRFHRRTGLFKKAMGRDLVTQKESSRAKSVVFRAARHFDGRIRE